MQTLRIAAWSGPRNISTAMMRSWENRPDTTVYDEPFYAHYLKNTGLNHPGKQQVLAHHENEWEKGWYLIENYSVKELEKWLNTFKELKGKQMHKLHSS